VEELARAVLVDREALAGARRGVERGKRVRLGVSNDDRAIALAHVEEQVGMEQVSEQRERAHDAVEELPVVGTEAGTLAIVAAHRLARGGERRRSYHGRLAHRAPAGPRGVDAAHLAGGAG
jgi:hypothetical protein